MNKNTLNKLNYILYNIILLTGTILIFLFLNKYILHIFLLLKTKRFLTILGIYIGVIICAIMINFRKRRNRKLIIFQFVIASIISVIAFSKIHFNEIEDDMFKEKIDLNSKKYYMQYNEDYIYSMYAGKGIKEWKQLPLEEKRLRLEYIIKNQCINLKMDTVPSMMFWNMKDLGKPLTIADYSLDDDCITIDLDYVENKPTECMEALCHEMKHRYQRMQIFLYDELVKDKKYRSYAKMKFFDDARSYKNENKNYKTQYNSSAEEYYNQKSEREAFEYAEQQMIQFSATIRHYNPENKTDL